MGAPGSTRGLLRSPAADFGGPISRSHRPRQALLERIASELADEVVEATARELLAAADASVEALCEEEC